MWTTCLSTNNNSNKNNSNHTKQNTKTTKKVKIIQSGHNIRFRSNNNTSHINDNNMINRFFLCMTTWLWKYFEIMLLETTTITTPTKRKHKNKINKTNNNNRISFRSNNDNSHINNNNKIDIAFILYVTTKLWEWLKW